VDLGMRARGVAGSLSSGISLVFWIYPSTDSPPCASPSCDFVVLDSPDSQFILDISGFSPPFFAFI